MSALTTDAAAGVGQVPCRAVPSSGVVIPFPVRTRSDNRLDTRDRIALLDWADSAAASGIAEVVIEHWECGDDPAVVGDFAMLYRRGVEWASWSLARSGGRYQVWEMAYSRTLGLFDTLAGALAFVTGEAASGKVSSTPPYQAACPKAHRTGTSPRAAAPTRRRASTR